MQYHAVNDEDLGTLVNKVNIYLNQDWVCQGGINVCQRQTLGPLYVQALVKRSDQPDELKNLEKLFDRRDELTATLRDRDLNSVNSMHHGFEKMEVEHEIIRCAERINTASVREGS
jgi:hypothetical protein